MAALSGEAISKEIWESNPVSISTDAVSDLDTQRTPFYGPQNGGAVPERCPVSLSTIASFTE